MEQLIVFQRLEAAVLFLGAIAVYFYNDLSWVYFLIFLFALDVSMIGYVVNSKVGATIYNIGHSLILPSLLVVVYVFMQNDILLGLICVWFAHIGLDRALGYGLKLPSGFRHTHLGDIGR